jgi:hypothetical protein
VGEGIFLGRRCLLQKKMPISITFDLFQEQPHAKRWKVYEKDQKVTESKTADSKEQKSDLVFLVDPSVQLQAAEHIVKPSFEPLLLAAQHPHPLDVTIRCDKHIYSVRWFLTPNCEFTQNSISVTKLIEDQFKKFEPEQVVQDMRHNERGKHIGKYAGMTDEQVLAKWKQACKSGKRVHRIIECFLNGMDIQPYTHFYAVQQFLRWYHRYMTEHNLKPFRTEMKIRSKADLLLTGTIDALFIRKDHPPPEQCESILDLEMIDWKFQEVLEAHSWGGKTGFAECSSVYDCRLNRHSLQQCAYQKMKQEGYRDYPYQGHIYHRVRIQKMSLLQLHDKLPEAVMHTVVPFQHVIQRMFDNRIAALEEKQKKSQ